MNENGGIKRKRRTRNNWSEKEREKLLAGFESSDMTAWAYARRHGIAPNSFYIWIKKKAKADAAKAPRFAKLEISPATSNHLMTVTLKSGLKLELDPDTSVDRIKELVQGLQLC